LARACGLQTIEWLFTAERHHENPLWTDEGVDRALRAAATSGVRVSSICADYFIERPLFRGVEQERHESVAVLGRLIECAARIGARTIVLPVIEDGSLTSAVDVDRLLEGLDQPLRLAAGLGIGIGLEMTCTVGEWLALLNRAASPALGACYDTGNTVAAGYDPATDLRQLHDHVLLIHIKDRPRGGASVALGRGDVDFQGVMETLVAIDYRGPLVLETPPGDDPRVAAVTHQRFVRSRLAAAYGSRVTP